MMVFVEKPTLTDKLKEFFRLNPGKIFLPEDLFDVCPMHGTCKYFLNSLVNQNYLDGIRYEVVKPVGSNRTPQRQGRKFFWLKGSIADIDSAIAEYQLEKQWIQHEFGLECPQCGSTEEAMVIETRPNRGGIRRRRHCMKCGSRFTTIEKPYEGAIDG